MRKRKEPVYRCQICGDTGSVRRAYREPGVGLPSALDLVPCPKCAKIRPEKDRHYALNPWGKQV